MYISEDFFFFLVTHANQKSSNQSVSLQKICGHTSLAWLLPVHGYPREATVDLDHHSRPLKG